MKIWALFLSVFTVFLTLFPCEDEMFVSTAQTETVSSSHKHGHEKHDGIDYCTPFCTCAISSVEELVPLVPQQLDIPNNPYFFSFYISFYSNEIVQNIFQPPRA